MKRLLEVMSEFSQQRQVTRATKYKLCPVVITRFDLLHSNSFLSTVHKSDDLKQEQDTVPSCGGITQQVIDSLGPSDAHINLLGHHLFR